MKKFNHVNVMSLIGICLDQKGKVIIVMPYMVNGDLLNYIKNNKQIDIERIYKFAIDIATGEFVNFNTKHLFYLDPILTRFYLKLFSPMSNLARYEIPS